MGGKVPEMKFSLWGERDIRGTNVTKREKYGEKYSGVKAANGALGGDSGDKVGGYLGC